MKKICAIHQPNFFPWLGYFQKIARADVFVLLDDVQFPKKGGSWTNRVKLNVQNQASWVTVPIVRRSGYWLNNQIEISDFRWQKKLVSTIQANYAKAPFFDNYSELIEDSIVYPETNLVKYNFRSIEKICQLLDISTDKMVVSSGLNIKTQGTQRLIDITRCLDCNTYLEGGGAAGYQDDSLFMENGIFLDKQEFLHPSYGQKKGADFLAGLSVIDALFYCGADSVKGFIDV